MGKKMLCATGILAVSLVSLLGCATLYSSKQVRINRPAESVLAAMASAQEKLNGSTDKDAGLNPPPKFSPFASSTLAMLATSMARAVHNTDLFLSPNASDISAEDNATTFPMLFSSYYGADIAMEIQMRAVTQELLIQEGHSIPSSPLDYKTKSKWTDLGLGLLNIGLEENYVYRNNAFTGERRYQSRKPWIIIEGAVDACSLVAAGGGLLSLSSGNTSGGVWAGLGVMTFCIDKLIWLFSNNVSLIANNNVLIGSGYNWDPNFAYESISDIRYETMTRK
jgi:hypothetical protein